jgi:hypothetical protein
VLICSPPVGIFRGIPARVDANNPHAKL